jgi:hypothetical protein
MFFYNIAFSVSSLSQTAQLMVQGLKGIGVLEAHDPHQDCLLYESRHIITCVGNLKEEILCKHALPSHRRLKTGRMLKRYSIEVQLIT